MSKSDTRTLNPETYDCIITFVAHLMNMDKPIVELTEEDLEKAKQEMKAGKVQYHICWNEGEVL